METLEIVYALQALDKVEASIDLLRKHVIGLKDKGSAYFGQELDRLVGEFRAHLEGLKEATEEVE